MKSSIYFSRKSLPPKVPIHFGITLFLFQQYLNLHSSPALVVWTLVWSLYGLLCVGIIVSIFKAIYIDPFEEDIIPIDPSKPEIVRKATFDERIASILNKK